MSNIVLASNLLRELASPRGDGEFIKTTIDRVSKLSKLKYWRAFDLWYKKARTVEEYELDQIREALRIKNEKAARNELHEAKLILARLEARLNAGDADFYRPHIDGLREASAGVGGSNSARRR
jgi:hypothetical protein